MFTLFMGNIWKYYIHFNDDVPNTNSITSFMNYYYLCSNKLNNHRALLLLRIIIYGFIFFFFFSFSVKIQKKPCMSNTLNNNFVTYIQLKTQIIYYHFQQYNTSFSLSLYMLRCYYYYIHK